MHLKAGAAAAGGGRGTGRMVGGQEAPLSMGTRAASGAPRNVVHADVGGRQLAAQPRLYISGAHTHLLDAWQGSGRLGDGSRASAILPAGGGGSAGLGRAARRGIQRAGLIDTQSGSKQDAHLGARKSRESLKSRRPAPSEPSRADGMEYQGPYVLPPTITEASADWAVLERRCWRQRWQRARTAARPHAAPPAPYFMAAPCSRVSL